MPGTPSEPGRPGLRREGRPGDGRASDSAASDEDVRRDFGRGVVSRFEARRLAFRETRWGGAYVVELTGDRTRRESQHATIGSRE